jgi:secretion/DNA translocation related TadE-like protein
MRDDLRSEDGSATVFGVAIIVGLVSLMMVMSSAGAWLLAHSHAASVADIAALAAATQGSCAAAHEAARINGSELKDCAWQGSDVIVVVSTEVQDTPMAVPVMRVEASARAGF